MNRIAGMESGANDYLLKPFDPQELVAKVKKLLGPSGDTQLTSRKN
jgi:DNA-binding response OmpR family regulator